MPARLLCLICGLAAFFLAGPTARAQDLASQLFNSLAAPQRALFDAFRDGEGAVRLRGAFNKSPGIISAVMQDADLAFGVGEPIFWSLEVAEPGQVFLFDIGSSGAARQISPNAFGPAIILAAGEARTLPLDRDGVTLFMGDQSRVQVWLALILPPDASDAFPVPGGATDGFVEGGANGLIARVAALADQGVPFDFALAAFGKETPPLAPEAVEQALALTREVSAQVQQALNDQGFDVGEVDGLFGANTRRGVGEWQVSKGWAATGYLNEFSLARLLSSETQLLSDQSL